MATRVKTDETANNPKYCYRVINWAEYDYALVNRGSLTVWFDAALVHNGVDAQLAVTNMQII
jgi:hypothetical protein